MRMQNGTVPEPLRSGGKPRFRGELRMLWNASNLTGYAIDATDGSIGSVRDFLFDDREWTIRWLVVDTGTWLSGRDVLLPPSAADEPDVMRRTFPVRLKRQHVENSPAIDDDAPVSRQHESGLYSYYGWDPYWAAYAYAPAGGLRTPIEPSPNAPGNRPGVEDRPEGDPHLRSTREVTGYYIHATDGDIGHVEDLLVDSDGWTIRYIVVDTKNWWPGKKVLVAPRSFTNVDWAEGSVRVNLTRDQIKSGPEYDPTTTVDRAYEERFHGYYGYPYYWV